LEFGIFLNSFDELTVLAAPVSAVKVTLIPCIKLTEGLILLDGIAIPCTQIGPPEPVRKITAAEEDGTESNNFDNVNHLHWPKH
jgi:hypothetical protein